MLTARVEALVNTVNTVGVMGKGIALQFKVKYPENFREYASAVKRDEVRVGSMLVVKLNRLDQLRYIINFPTKQHWKSPSRLVFITEGLSDLRRILIELDVKSVALPPLGCGNGGLDWNTVKTLIERELADLDIDIQVYEPSSEVMARLKAESIEQKTKLTPARAMLLRLLYHYLDLGESASEFAAEKIMYFLQRAGEPQLKLDFKKYYYGPYSGNVRHVLYAMEGQYIKGTSLKSNRPFEPLELIHERMEEVNTYIREYTSAEQQDRVEFLTALFDGFQSPAGLELLASLDWLIREYQTTNQQILGEALKNWTSRKRRMFTDYQIRVALQRLEEYRSQLYPELTGIIAMN